MATIKSIEEKAKAYDKVLEWATEAHKVCDGMLKEDLEHLFPELKESEDERIRKAIIELVKQSSEILEKKNQEAMLDWLEKQGEHVKFRDSIQVGDKVTRNEDGVLVNLSQLNRVAKKDEKQGEQKPANKVEPKFKVKYAGSEYNVLEVKDIVGVTYYGIEDEPNHIDYVKADNCEIISGGYGIKENGSPYPTKPAVFSEQNPAWSEEDGKMYNAILRDVRNGEPLDKLQYDWLKSLRPQNTWKPSEESFNNTSCTHLSKKEAESKVWKQ